MSLTTATESPVEFIGYIAPHEASEIRPLQGPGFDPDYLVRVARTHEDGGFAASSPPSARGPRQARCEG